MTDYERIEKVIVYLESNFCEQPKLGELAKLVDLSAFHFQRLFTRWAGVSPKVFLQCVTHQHARHLLAGGKSVLDVSLRAGLSGPGRLHDLFVKLEAATPGEVKRCGEGWYIDYGFVESPFGTALLAEGPRGLCHLSFVDTFSEGDALLDVQRQWAKATFRLNQALVEERSQMVFRQEKTENMNMPIRAYVSGSEFQVKVWRALLEVPPGEVVSYGEVANHIGKPSASRAVGTAVGRNTLAYLIPCHRVIRSTGGLGGYRWGMRRKQALLARERAMRLQES